MSHHCCFFFWVNLVLLLSFSLVDVPLTFIRECQRATETTGRGRSVHLLYMLVLVLLCQIKEKCDHDQGTLLFICIYFNYLSLLLKV